MPAKNSRKQYTADSFYHLYNRGVERRIIFVDEQDYAVFTSYLKTYLLPKDIKQLQSIIADTEKKWREKDKAIKQLRLNNFADCLKLIGYCLMPNHFHLLFKQQDATAIDRFMNSLCTRYTMYFNRKYKRVGHLFQSVYKAVLVESDEQLLHLSRYVHRNPLNLALQGLALQKMQNLRDFKYSSYRAYLESTVSTASTNQEKYNFKWLHPEFILPSFASSGVNSYQYFVENQDIDEHGENIIQILKIDEI